MVFLIVANQWSAKYIRRRRRRPLCARDGSDGVEIAPVDVIGVQTSLVPRSHKSGDHGMTSWGLDPYHEL